MKASELIQELTALIEERGDLECTDNMENEISVMFSESDGNEGDEDLFVFE